MAELGRLKKVELREVWSDEANDFTPWLAREDNLKVLADTIGLELELEATEKNVGPFKADILCKDTMDGHWVLIENQLERTDHTHLGQLLTYASGLKAVTIVWVAKYFTEEHRAALDWLNEITDESFNFFGLEVELWQIGDSNIAPKFNLASKPNDWSRAVHNTARTASELTPTKQAQFEFWTAFRAYMQDEGSFIRCQKAAPHHWMNHAIGKSGFGLCSIASSWDSEAGNFDQPEIQVNLMINLRGAKKYFAILEAQKDSIEREIGESLIWHNPEDKRRCRIYIRQPADFMNQKDWPAQHAWLKKYLEKFHAVFAPRIKKLDISEYEMERDAEVAEAETL